MNIVKLLAYLGLWSLLAVIFRSFLPAGTRLFEPRSALFVLALPWLVAFVGDGPREALDALRCALAARAADLPAERRARGAALLRKLAGLSLSTGLLAFFASAVATLNAIAGSGGQANPMEFLSAAPAALLAPLFGFLLGAFVYEPLATSLECQDSGLGAALEE